MASEWTIVYLKVLHEINLISASMQAAIVIQCDCTLVTLEWKVIWICSFSATHSLYDQLHSDEHTLSLSGLCMGTHTQLISLSHTRMHARMHLNITAIHSTFKLLPWQPVSLLQGIWYRTANINKNTHIHTQLHTVKHTWGTPWSNLLGKNSLLSLWAILCQKVHFMPA